MGAKVTTVTMEISEEEWEKALQKVLGVGEGPPTDRPTWTVNELVNRYGASRNIVERGLRKAVQDGIMERMWFQGQFRYWFKGSPEEVHNLLLSLLKR